MRARKSENNVEERRARQEKSLRAVYAHSSFHYLVSKTRTAHIRTLTFHREIE